MQLDDLKKPFPADDVEWRLGQCGKNDKGIWAKCLAYITSRAVMNRLDDVVGPGNWRDEYIPHIAPDADGKPCGYVECRLSIRINDEWVTKSDAAPTTDFESVKGGYSDSLKRAAVKWGIGRYLYDLDEGWAITGSDCKHFQPANDRKGLESFRWNPPPLPKWALPESKGVPPINGVTKGAENGVKWSDAYRTFREQIEEVLPKLKGRPKVNFPSGKEVLSWCVQSKLAPSISFIQEQASHEKLEEMYFKWLEIATAQPESVPV